MKLTLFFKNIKHTPALDSRIEQKSGYLSKYFEGGFEVQWYCYAKTGVHIADVCVIASKHRYRASAKADNLYKCLDMVMDKVEKQLYRDKDKRSERTHRKGTDKNKVVYLFKEEGKIRKTREEEAS